MKSPRLRRALILVLSVVIVVEAALAVVWLLEAQRFRKEIRELQVPRSLGRFLV